MDEFEDLSREQLTQLLVAALEQIKQQAARISALEQQINGGPGAAPATAKPLPAWVKPNSPNRPKTPRKKRDFACVRPREERPDHNVENVADNCPDCGRKLCGGTIHHTREVIDLPPVRVETTQHRVMSRWCGVCKKRVLAKAEVSSQASGKGRIGIRLMSLIGYLRSICRLPVRKILELLAAQYRVKLSDGEIVRILTRIATQGATAVASLLTRIRNSPVVHADETGWRENGKGGYLWSFSTPDTRYYIRAGSRGSDVVKTALGEVVYIHPILRWYTAGGY